MQNKESFTRWLPLVGLTFAVFVFNTSEFMPIGLLTDIATDLNISEARAGLLISVYAWVVAIMSLPLMIMVSKMELKRLLLSIIALFVVSHVASAFAEGYYTLMLSRIGVACAHAIFWSIASPLAVRTVPDGKRALALSAIATGSSVAMVVGLPLGRTLCWLANDVSKHRHHLRPHIRVHTHGISQTAEPRQVRLQGASGAAAQPRAAGRVHHVGALRYSPLHWL